MASGLGLMGSKGGKSAADKAAAQSDATRQQQPLIDMIVRAGQEGWNAYQGASRSGAFDAEAERQNILTQFDQLQERGTKNNAAMASLGGYRPGDSVVRQQSLLTRNALERDTAMKLTGLRRSLLQARLGALAATNPQLAGQAAGLIQGNANTMANIRLNDRGAGNPADLLASILPYLNREKPTGEPTGFGGRGVRPPPGSLGGF